MLIKICAFLTHWKNAEGLRSLAPVITLCLPPAAYIKVVKGGCLSQTQVSYDFQRHRRVPLQNDIALHYGWAVCLSFNMKKFVFGSNYQQNNISVIFETHIHQFIYYKQTHITNWQTDSRYKSTSRHKGAPLCCYNVVFRNLPSKPKTFYKHIEILKIYHIITWI